jgi:hypothetical protein
MPTDLTSKSRNHRQPEAFPHIPASWLLLCAEYKLLIFPPTLSTTTIRLLLLLLLLAMLRLFSDYDNVL